MFENLLFFSSLSQPDDASRDENCAILQLYLAEVDPLTGAGAVVKEIRAGIDDASCFSNHPVVCEGESWLIIVLNLGVIIPLGVVRYFSVGGPG